MTETLNITKERVLEAAGKCETAKATLKVLFPEIFEVSDPKYYEVWKLKGRAYHSVRIPNGHLGGGLWVHVGPMQSYGYDNFQTYEGEYKIADSLEDYYCRKFKSEF